VEWFREGQVTRSDNMKVAAVLPGLTEIELEYHRERHSAGISVAIMKGVYKGRRKGATKNKPSGPWS
jgi:hypothetical protein